MSHVHDVMPSILSQLLFMMINGDIDSLIKLILMKNVISNDSDINWTNIRFKDVDLTEHPEMVRAYNYLEKMY